MNFTEFARQECPVVVEESEIVSQPSLSVPMIELPEWQLDFCTAHGLFMGNGTCCPFTFDECPITRIIEAAGDIEKLRGIDLGQGVTSDQVIDTWLGSGEPAKDLFRKPVWLFCVAEHLANNKSVESA